jgi:hypothetical protein
MGLHDRLTLHQIESPRRSAGRRPPRDDDAAILRVIGDGKPRKFSTGDVVNHWMQDALLLPSAVVPSANDEMHGRDASRVVWL